MGRLLPAQGTWTEEDYLDLDTNHLLEFTDGFVEVLPMPTTSHQRVVQRLSSPLMAFVAARNLGTALFAPLPIRLRDNKFCEPDVFFVSSERAHLMGERFWTGADLVMEVVSDDPGSHERDHVKKRADYAAAGIPEYWIVDPQQGRITVLKLAGKTYAVHGEYDAGAAAESALLPGFRVEVSQVLQFVK
jgi:Uma2 family endonuclease